MLRIKSTLRPMLTLPMLLAVAGCITSGPIIADKASCSALLPDSWDQGVPDAPDPAAVPPAKHAAPVGSTEASNDPSVLRMLLIDTKADRDHATDVAKSWIDFGIGQTGQLKTANEHYTDARGIERRCEARDAAAVKKSRPKVLGIL